MLEQEFCSECGVQLSPEGRFCGRCGAAIPGRSANETIGERASAEDPSLWSVSQSQAEPAAPPAATTRGAAAEGARPIPAGSQPTAAEFAGQLGGQLKTPGAVLALAAAGAAIAAAVTVGLLLALALPDESLIGVTGSDDNAFTETMRLAAATSMARAELDGESDGLVPLLVWAVPLGAIALSVRLRRNQMASSSPTLHLLWATATAVPAAIGFAILALASGGTYDGRSVEINVGSALFFGFLTGVIGGAVGVWLSRRGDPRFKATNEHRVGRWLPALTVPLRSLAALLAATGIVCVLGHEIQTLKGEAVATFGRSIPVAITENALQAGELAVLGAGAGMFSELAAGPIPPSDGRLREYGEKLSGNSAPAGVTSADIAEFFGDFDMVVETAFSADRNENDSGTRLLSLSKAYEPYVFIPLLLLLTALACVTALYAGYATARRMAPPTLAVSVGFGALSGVVWALSLTVLQAIDADDFVPGESLFASTLLVAVIAGALGGVLAAQRHDE